MYKLYARTLAREVWFAARRCWHCTYYSHCIARLSQNLTAVSRREVLGARMDLGTPRGRSRQQRACVLLCVLPLHLLNLISELTLKFCTLCAQQSLCLLAITRLDSKPWLSHSCRRTLIARTGVGHGKQRVLCERQGEVHKYFEITNYQAR